MKARVAIITTLVAFLAILCSMSGRMQSGFIWMPAETSWAESYESIEEISTEADLIVVGTVEGILEVTSRLVAELRGGPYFIYYTDFAFSVEQVLKGPQDATEVMIHQTGAEGKLEVSDDPLLKPGDEYVMFLHEYETGKYYIMGGPQGRFPIIEGEVFSMDYILPVVLDLWLELGVEGMEKESFLESVLANIGS